ncbi:hypothetical protein GGG16DRAFT_43149 [Schizophyllum commune]
MPAQCAEMDLLLSGSAHTISRRSNSNVPNRGEPPHAPHRKKSHKSKKNDPSSSSSSAIPSVPSRGILRRNLDSFGLPLPKSKSSQPDPGPALRSRPNIAYTSGPKLPEPPTHARHSSLPSSAAAEERRLNKGKQREFIEDDALSSATEADHLRDEIEQLKKLVHEQKKTMKKQKKQLEEREREASSAKLNKQEQDAQIQTLKSKCRKNDELVSTIEAAMQCQICMDLMVKPFALSPCGHVLCLECLQNWFRSAPTQEETDLDPEDPDFVLCRQKSCPCCRAVVTRKPVPIFIVKNVAQALARAKDHATPPPAAAETPEEDPWRGIFLSDTESDGYLRDDMDEESLYEYGYTDDEAFIGGMLGFGIYAETDPESVIGSDDDLGGLDEEDDEDEDADPEFVFPIWEPPAVPFIDPQDYAGTDVTDEDIRMMQRGCTLPMIRHYSMQYEHHRGLTAFVSTTDTRRPNEYCLMLGWNVHLQPDDLDGANYITDVLDQVDAIYDGLAPEIAWDVWSDEDGVVHAQLKVPAHPTAYTDTDTEEWLD